MYSGITHFLYLQRKVTLVCRLPLLCFAKEEQNLLYLQVLMHQRLVPPHIVLQPAKNKKISKALVKTIKRLKVSGKSIQRLT